MSRCSEQPPKIVNCRGDGERGRNRTFNLLIKSQLLCQLSYAPGMEFCLAGQFVIVTFSGCAVIARAAWDALILLAYGAERGADLVTKGRRQTGSYTGIAIKRKFLGTLPRLRSQASGTFADNWATRRIWPHSRAGAPLDRADYGSIVHAIGVSHRDKPLFGAQAVNHPLLATAEHGVRKNGKVPEHPEKI